MHCEAHSGSQALTKLRSAHTGTSGWAVVILRNRYATFFNDHLKQLQDLPYQFGEGNLLFRFHLLGGLQFGASMRRPSYGLIEPYCFFKHAADRPRENSSAPGLRSRANSPVVPNRTLEAFEVRARHPQ